MATICYAYRLTPDEYRALTVDEEAAFVWLLKELKKRGER